MVEWKKLVGWVGVLLCLGVPIAYALTASFSDTIWAVPTIQADAYYIGATTDVTPILQYPHQPTSYTIWVSGGVYYAKNGGTGAVTSNADAATLTQAVFANMTGGGELTFLQGTYAFSSSVTYEPQYKMHIVGYGAVFKPSANTISVLRIHQGVLMTNGGCVIEGISFTNPESKTDCTAIEIFDSYGATVKNCYFTSYHQGILLNNYDFWVESTIIEETTFYDCTSGIVFYVDGGTNSFGQLCLRNIYIHVPAGSLGNSKYGIYQPNGCSIYRSTISNVVFWLGGDYSTGWYCNGDFTDAQINLAGEATTGTPTQIYGVYLDAGSTYGRSTIGNSSYTFTYNFWGNKFSEEVHGYNTDENIITADSDATYIDGILIDDYLTSKLANYTGPTVITQASAYDYIISKIGVTYYANSTSGGTNYSGSNAGTVINSAIDAVNGGSHYLKAGTYTLTASTQIDLDQAGTTLIGAGQDTVIQTPAGFADSIIHVSAQGCTIRDLNVDGTGQTAGYGIYIEGTRGYFNHIRVEDCFSDGIHIGHSAWSGVMGGKITDCTVTGNSGNGIYIDYDATDWEILNCLIDQHDAAGMAGIVVDASSTMISLCHLWGNENNIIVAPAHHVYRLRLVQNGIMDCDENGIKWASSKTWRDSVITGNMFWAQGYEAPYEDHDAIYLGGSGSLYGITITGNSCYGYKEDVAQRCTRYFINDVNDKLDYSIITGNTIDRCANADPIYVQNNNNKPIPYEDFNIVYNCG